MLGLGSVIVWAGLHARGVCDDVADGASQAAQREFFEKEIRPLLVEKCHRCHGAQQQKGGLRLDAREFLLRGGDSGPAVVPGKPEESLLIEAVNYDPQGYQMPPTGKLSDEQIGKLTVWVQQGAFWPAEGTQVSEHPQSDDLFQRQQQHWAFQPLMSPELPEVQHPEWCENPIDRFILARLEAEGLKPNPPAEPATLLRRVCVELTGLPPTPEELDAYLQDTAPGAYERAVERWLASPHYGERWARHWLDLVRYAETAGHEFDYEYPHAWPYRDYVIRAFNADVPYDVFVQEHLAGDVWDPPRRDPTTGRIESVIGPAFFWFGQGKHSPVDLLAEQADALDNQIDVLGKAFLGLTLSCARCHDHKFDPIRQQDYYALAGFLLSSRRTEIDGVPPEVYEQWLQTYHQHEKALASGLWEQALSAVETTLRSAQEQWQRTHTLPAAWMTMLERAAADADHPWHLIGVAWFDPPRVTQLRQAWGTASTVKSDQSGVKGSADAEDASRADAASAPDWWRDPSRWRAEGLAFRRSCEGDWLPVWHGPPSQPLSALVPTSWVAHSGTVSAHLRGKLRSPTFVITQPYLDYRAWRVGGTKTSRPLKNGQIHLIVDGFQFIKDPLYGNLSLDLPPDGQPRWYRQHVAKFIGHTAYIEFEDNDDGVLVVEAVIPHAGTREALRPDWWASQLAEVSGEPASLIPAALASCIDLVRGLHRHRLYGVSPVPSAALNAAWAVLNEVLALPVPETLAVAPQGQAWVRWRKAHEAELPQPEWVMTTTEGTALDAALLVRGNPHKPAERVPRRFLELASQWGVSSAVEIPPAGSWGSGRLALAEMITHPQNPLTARVIVNRLWHHHFGRGIVPTPDDFGHMGQPPTHPELLDWLARELMRADWSLKHIQRLLVTSQTYRQSSRRFNSDAEQRDPTNRWWHRAQVQRLEAEALRDALLRLSGRFDDRMYGPSVPVHLTSFMEGRGRPTVSGPLDGAGRRSVYQAVRRNFLPPLFLAFDFPTPLTTMGRRSTSNVPAQALVMLNNPFVWEAARSWAQRAQHAAPTPTERIRQMYRQAVAREPTAAEEQLALEYVHQHPEHGWDDVAHVLLNMKEFLYVE
ncbi:MAG: hypothetical protein KatS3mg114_0343 [Planctomycetaceae bacterium]|nr:MAG: hypothetical protein KatS3mg114_0343 [Planctomycetaceae bacterium]